MGCTTLKQGWPTVVVFHRGWSTVVGQGKNEFEIGLVRDQELNILRRPLILSEAVIA